MARIDAVPATARRRPAREDRRQPVEVGGRRVPVGRLRLGAVVGVVSLAALTGACASAGSGGLASGPSVSSAPAVSSVSAAAPGAPGAPAQAAAPRKKVLFIRGAEGTTGVEGGTNDNDLSDILSTTNHGLSDLSLLLAANGFDVTQLEEGSTSEGKTAVDLADADLSQYDVVVFGSNNAFYEGADAEALDDYVRAGGGALFASDRNWGKDPTRSADSDQVLLKPFGITVGLDAGVENTEGNDLFADEATDPSHPLVAGIEGRISGAGVASYSEKVPVSGVTVTGLIPAKGTVVDNDAGEGREGTRRAAGPDDFAVLLVEAGTGRVVCTFDRDTFFNGVITEAGNQRYALNVFRWLAKA